MSERPLSPDPVVECLTCGDVDSIILPPSVLEEMSGDPGQTQALAKLKLAIVLGGALDIRDLKCVLVLT